MYEVFKRTWWKNNSDWPNGLEPHAGRPRRLGLFDTEEEAREHAMFFNRMNQGDTR